MENKKLKKGTEKMVFGVCDGIAKYFNVDTNIVRIATVLLSLVSGIGIIAYIAGAILMPTDETVE